MAFANMSAQHDPLSHVCCPAFTNLFIFLLKLLTAFCAGVNFSLSQGVKPASLSKVVNPVMKDLILQCIRSCDRCVYGHDLFFAMRPTWSMEQAIDVLA